MGGCEVAERGLRTKGRELYDICQGGEEGKGSTKCIVDTTRTELDGRSTGTGAIGNELLFAELVGIQHFLTSLRLCYRILCIKA